MATAKTKTTRAAATSRLSRPLPPPANVLPPEGPRYMRTLVLAVVGALCVIILIGSVLAANFFDGVGKFCNQKVQAATEQARQQTSELQGISLFGSEPHVRQDLDDDCLDGDGSGVATSTYELNNIGFTQANDEVLRVMGGTESPFSGDSESSLTIGTISTTVTAANGKMYDVEFLLTNSFNCPATVTNGICESNTDPVQAYNLQNEPINEIDITVHGSNS